MFLFRLTHLYWPLVNTNLMDLHRVLETVLKNQAEFLGTIDG